MKSWRPSVDETAGMYRLRRNDTIDVAAVDLFRRLSIQPVVNASAPNPATHVRESPSGVPANSAAPPAAASSTPFLVEQPASSSCRPAHSTAPAVTASIDPSGMRDFHSYLEEAKLSRVFSI